MRTEELREVLEMPGPPNQAGASVSVLAVRQGTGASRVPLAAVPPVMDCVALVAAVVLGGRVDVFGLLFAVLAFAALQSFGRQSAQINPRLTGALGPAMGAVAVPLVAVALATGSAAEAGRLLVVGPWAVGLVLLLRGMGFALVRSARRHGLVREPIIIVGAGEIGREVAKVIREHPEYGLLPVGFVDSVTDGDLPLPVLGGIEELEHIVRVTGARRLIIAFGLTREADMVTVLRTCDQLPVDVHVVPRFFELGLSVDGRARDDLWGVPLIRLRRAALRTVAWRTKRAFDLVVGSTALVVTSPLFLASALAVRLSGRGPVLFRQVRVGQRGQLFKCLKFRTMRLNDEADTCWGDGADERVTRVGRALRRLSLDELPQLLNVLGGHMSLIGPRPERPFFVDRFSREIARYGDRHRVPAGITGWAQVHGLRGDTSIPERIRFDNYYIENWSMWLDLSITARTIWAIVTGRH